VSERRPCEERSREENRRKGLCLARQAYGGRAPQGELCSTETFSRSARSHTFSQAVDQRSYPGSESPAQGITGCWDQAQQHRDGRHGRERAGDGRGTDFGHTRPSALGGTRQRSTTQEAASTSAGVDRKVP